MKYTINNFQQQKLIQMGLDDRDALILQWFGDWVLTEQMEQREINGKPHYWVNYGYVNEQFPIFGYNDPKHRVIRERFKKYKECGLMTGENFQYKDEYGKSGTKAYFRFVPSKLAELFTYEVGKEQKKTKSQQEHKITTAQGLKITTAQGLKITTNSSLQRDPSHQNIYKKVEILLEYYNNKNINKNININNYKDYIFDKHIKIINNYMMKDIEKAIDNYDCIYHDNEKYILNHAWEFPDFILNIHKFVEDAKPFQKYEKKWINYNNQKPQVRDDFYKEL